MTTSMPNRIPLLAGILPLMADSELPARIVAAGQAGVSEPAWPITVASLAAFTGAPLMVVLPRSRDAEAFERAVSQWAADVCLYPAWEVLPGEEMSPTLDTMGRRMDVLRRLSTDHPPAVIVTAVRAFLQRTPPPPPDIIQLRPGQEVELDDLVQRFVEVGYERNYLVERPGEFSVRGGIVDFYPPGSPTPFRADLFGDEITELSEFSVSSQRSGQAVGSAAIVPARELRLTDEVRQRAADAARSEDDPQRAADLTRLSEGLVFPGMESYLPIVAGPLSLPVEFLPEDASVIVVDPKQCRDTASAFLAQAAEWTPSMSDMFGSFEDSFGGATRIELWPFGRGEEAPEVEVRGWDDTVGRPDALAVKLDEARTKGATIVVAAGRAAARAAEVLADAGMSLQQAEARVKGAVVSEAEVERGFLLTEQASPVLALVGYSDLFGKRRAAPVSQDGPARATALLLELATGDFVVHESYGVGRYHGMVTRELGGISRDYLIIEYHGQDRLYLPTEQLEAITRYTGGDAPRLNRLGTQEWERAKSRAKKAVADIAGELIVLYSKRIRAEGHAFSPDSPWQAELEDAFIHIETPDQERAIEEVKADMERIVPMDRLICGDVGYGKTEVAVRAAFKAVQDSKQVAVLVPTTILAQQHSQTFAERFAGFPVKVAQLSRFLSPSEQQNVLEEVASGKVDVVIGTHRLLQADIKFQDLGLLVVDEEQRFGVKHKERIKQLRENVDVITMTATPIPRTLEMGLTGIRDLSLMDTPPVDRRPVLTYVGETDERMITAAIRRELARDGQVFYVHNRVRSIRGAARKIAGLVPGARVEVAHGQMTETELERVMIDVWDGKIDVLVCTTIIESGLDIPAMNTLIVERADMLGLSQLYQLRGRVGRARERAYAYFFYPHEAALTDEAHERLKTLSEFTELGSGFKIALRDLEIRGAGNLLGAEQSGHIAAVGFDLYMRMMSEAVAQMSGAEPKVTKIEVKLDLPTDAFVPADYIARESLRMEAYRQIEKIRSDEDADSLREELVDRYGPLPDPVENLLKVAQLRVLLSDNAVTEVSVRDGVMKIRPFPLLADSQEVRLRRKFPGAVYKQASDTLLLPLPAAKVASWALDSVRAILA